MGRRGRKREGYVCAHIPLISGNVVLNNFKSIVYVQEQKIIRTAAGPAVELTGKTWLKILAIK